MRSFLLPDFHSETMINCFRVVTRDRSLTQWKSFPRSGFPLRSFLMNLIRGIAQFLGGFFLRKNEPRLRGFRKLSLNFPSKVEGTFSFSAGHFCAQCSFSSAPPLCGDNLISRRKFLNVKLHPDASFFSLPFVSFLYALLFVILAF